MTSQKHFPALGLRHADRNFRLFQNVNSHARDTVMDRDLVEVTIEKLQTMYAMRKYTRNAGDPMYLNRIAR